MSGDSTKTLLDQTKFREYFQERIDNSQDRWNVFENNLGQAQLDELITNLEIFRDEIIFILNNIDIRDEEAFEFLKRMSAIISNTLSPMS